MAKGKKGKGKKAPKILTPKRCTINIVYCWRGLSMGTLGMGGPYRRIRTLLLMEFRRAEISIVGNGTAALPSSDASMVACATRMSPLRGAGAMIRESGTTTAAEKLA